MTTSVAHTAMALLTVATQDPPVDVDPTTGQGEEWGKAAPVGLLITLLMGIAVYFLIKSMNRNLKKVPATFDPPTPPEGGRGDDGRAGDLDGAATPSDSAESDPVEAESVAERIERSG